MYEAKLNNKRRQLGAGLLSLSALGVCPSVWAQDFDEGIDYRVLRQPVATASPDKIEVLEFFWYGCPHCKSFEGPLASWKASLAKDVVFRKVHVPFREETHQRLFYSLESMGIAEKLASKVFEAIHVERKPIISLEDQKRFAKANGVDPVRYEKAWMSFSVQSQMRRANALMQAYRIDGVPQLAVNGRYVTSPAMVGGHHQRALAVVDHLVAKERRAT
jgi:thiol:disulfide interchange protein DsbA